MYISPRIAKTFLKKKQDGRHCFMRYQQIDQWNGSKCPDSNV